MYDTANVYKLPRYMKVLVPVIGLGIIFTTVTFAITIATLVKVNQGFDGIHENDKITTIGSTLNPTSSSSSLFPSSTINPTTPSTSNGILSSSIRITKVMQHLNALQNIGAASQGTRAINTAGFNQTLDYITGTLRNNTDFIVIESFFYITQRIVIDGPILRSSINGVIQNYTYSTDSGIADFFIAQWSASTNSTEYIPLTVIPELGCDDADWASADPPANGSIVLVERGNCTFVAKAAFAMKYNAAALLIYNDGNTPNDIAPITINLGSNNTIPALFLSNILGENLAQAAANASANVSILLNVFLDNVTFPVGNICADTPTGNITQTIVIGSHSDSVPAGPGINDNGSGSAVNLELALALYRLFQTSTYEKYKYRIRFCWWGAEEIGLVGSDYHVTQANVATTPGERLSDYLINLNYDMLGSPNFMFGVYHGRTAPPDTPTEALSGSNKITNLFVDWFTEQNLPWDYTDFSGRSDYGPFLAEGIVAGGLFSGADDIKTPEQYNRYYRMLGPNLAGNVNETHDQCYHRACDDYSNISVFALEKMIQAAGYALEYLARQDDLQTWLYPNGTVNRASTYKQERLYDPVNEHFKIPYF